MISLLTLAVCSVAYVAHMVDLQLQLKVYSKDQVAALDGGMVRWTQEGYPLQGVPLN